MLDPLNTIKIEQMEREKELAIQALSCRIELMETSKSNVLKKDSKLENIPVGKLSEKLVATRELKITNSSSE